MGLNILDLAPKTESSNGDLLHINTGNTDYKQLKSDFLYDVPQRTTFNTISTLFSQIDALPKTGKKYYGIISSYGHQQETGVPINANFYVDIYINNSNSANVRITVVGTSGRSFYANKNSGTWGDWVEEPSRDEMNLFNGHIKFGSFTNTSAFSIPMNNAQFAAGILLFRLVQGVGPLVLKFQIQSGTLSVTNLAGQTYSNANLVITLSGTNLVLKNGSNTGNSTVLAIYT